MANSRKYILNICNKISCGLGSCTNIGQTYNLLNSFVNEGVAFPQLTVDELSKLNNIDYDNRVLSYLDYIDIGSDTEKQILFSGATENDSDCIPLYCKLNPEFLVYKFLNGVRVINVGESNVGCRLEYKAYPLNSNEDDYPWQSYCTFTDLDMNGVYVFKIRDYSPGYNAVVCEYEKIISLPLILPSTTTTKGVRTISLNETYKTLTGSGCFEKGLFQITQPLSNGECMRVNYNVTVANVGTNSLGSVELKCNSGDGNYVQYAYITSKNGVSPTGSFILCQNQSMCYSLSASAFNGGESSNAYLKIDSVDGCNTNISTVNSSLCEKYISYAKAIQPIYFALGNSTIEWSNPPDVDAGTKCGNLLINPPISNNSDIVNIVLSGTTPQHSPSTGAMYITVYKSCGTEPGYVSLGTCEGTTSKPNFYYEFTITSGDSVCYNIGGTAYAGNLSSGIRISSVSSTSTTILPQISTPDRDSFAVTATKVNVPVLIKPIIPYHESNVGNTLNYCSCEIGTFELGSSIASVSDVSGNLYRRVCICYDTVTLKCGGNTPSVPSTVEIWCSPYSNPTVSKKIACHTNLSTGQLPSTLNCYCTVGNNAKSSFTFVYGDKICYKLYAGMYNQTCLKILCVSDAYPYGNGKIIPYIFCSNGVPQNNDYIVTTTTSRTLCQP
jgi:hypothetical protein